MKPVPLEAAIVRSRTAARRVLARFEAEHRRLERSKSERAAVYYASLVPSSLTILPPNAEPNAMKYAREHNGHIRKWRHFLPFLAGLQKGYEIGVGPGYLFRLLMDVHDIDMRGCDLDPAKNLIFRELRKELRISHLVDQCEVSARKEIPIPAGTDAIVAFWTVFNVGWGPSEHAWFLDFCRERLVGDKRVALLFNARGFDDREDVREFYRRRAEFPLLNVERQGIVARDLDAFCIVHL